MKMALLDLYWFYSGFLSRLAKAIQVTIADKGAVGDNCTLQISVVLH